MQAISISHWLTKSTQELTDSETPRLDAELILASTLRRERTWLHAHSESDIPARFLDIANARLSLRLDDVPMAYILGKKEFYGRDFSVTPAVLIPRPDSEVLIELLDIYLTSHSAKTCVDVGTGSGCLGITAKLEHPELQVTLLDISKPALAVAQKNADTLGAEVRTIKSNLLASYPLRADIIIANLPYVDTSWEVSPGTRHEPQDALFAKKGGLQLIEKLIGQTSTTLSRHGALILEADPRQHSDIITLARANGLTHQQSNGFGLLFTND